MKTVHKPRASDRDDQPALIANNVSKSQQRQLNPTIQSRSSKLRVERQVAYANSKPVATRWSALITKRREAKHRVFNGGLWKQMPTHIPPKSELSVGMEHQIGNIVALSDVAEHAQTSCESRHTRMHVCSKKEVSF